MSKYDYLDKYPNKSERKRAPKRRMSASTSQAPKRYMTGPSKYSVASKRRSTRSRTRTMTRRKRSFRRRRQNTKPTRRFVKKVARAQQFAVNHPSWFLTSQAGVLVSHLDSQAFSAFPFSVMGGAVDIFAIQTAFQAQISLNENATFQILKWTQNYKFHNSTNTEIYLHLYEVVARRDVPYVVGIDPAACLARGCANMDPGTGTAALTIAAAGTQKVPAGGTPDLTPYMIPELTTVWKITRAKRYVIQAGGIINYKRGLYRPFTCNMAQYYNTSTASPMILGEKGKLRYLVYRLYGAPSSDVTANSGANTTGVSQASLTWTAVERVLVGYNEFQNHTRYFYSRLGGYGQTTPNVISEAAGAPVAVAIV